MYMKFSSLISSLSANVLESAASQKGAKLNCANYSKKECL